MAREVYDDFVSAFVDHTRTLRVGDPLSEDTDVGPMVSAPQRAKVEAQVEAAVARAPSWCWAAGAPAFPRSLLRARGAHGLPAETELLREETFGPVAPIVPVDSLDEAIALANGTLRPGRERLHARPRDCGALLARDPRRNGVDQRPLTDNDAGPFGGFKQSGFGRELGQEGLEAFQETKHVHIETKIAPKEWWYPYGRPMRRPRRAPGRERPAGGGADAAPPSGAGA